LTSAPDGARLPAHDGDRPRRPERRVERRDDVRVERLRRRDPSASEAPVTVSASAWRSGCELAEHRRDAAGAMQLLDEVLARRVGR
jgi:hypothetical protein